MFVIHTFATRWQAWTSLREQRVYSPINAPGSSFFLIVIGKEVLEEDSVVSGLVYIESALIPSTFVKVDHFNVTTAAIISLDIPLKFDMDQDDLILLDDGSYHDTISIQRDKGPITSPVEQIV